jgi:hypothetical protein
MLRFRATVAVLVVLSLFIFGTLQPVHAADDEGADDIKITPVKIDNNTFKGFNPLMTHGNGETGTGRLVDEYGAIVPGEAISIAINEFGFPIAALILFVMLLWGGFEMLSGAASKKSIDDGKQRIMAALLGFLLLFVSYWIVQIAGTLLGVNVLG